MNILEDCDYFVRYIPLPGSVGGIITPNSDGTYSIYLNSNQSQEMQMEGLEHEVNHIRNCDFDGDKDIREIEGWIA